MTELYNLNFLTSITKNAIVTKRLENVISATEIIRIAKECKLIERERYFDVVEFVCGLLDFNDRGSLSTSKYTISNSRLNYYGHYASRSISDKAFHNQIRKLEFIKFLEALPIKLSAYTGKDNPRTAHQELVNLLSSLGITDVVPVNRSNFFVRLSCRNNFNCNTAGRKRTQRGVQQENAGIKVHMAFSNFTGAISHVNITEGTGSERAQIRADEYAESTLFTMDRGYIDYDGEKD